MKDYKILMAPNWPFSNTAPNYILKKAVSEYDTLQQRLRDGSDGRRVFAVVSATVTQML